ETAGALASDGIQGYEPSSCREQNSWRIVAIARPVRDSTLRRLAVLNLVAPDFLSSFRFERNDTISGGEVHHTVHHNGSGFRRRPPPRRIRPVCPHLREARDVRCVDLRQRRISRACQVVIVRGPFVRGISLPRRLRECKWQNCDGKDDGCKTEPHG